MQTYNTVVFYLRSLLAPLNFPEFITEEDVLRVGSISTDMSAASIRSKATEVGTRVDALETMHNHGPVESNSGWASVKPDLNEYTDPENLGLLWKRMLEKVKV